MKYILAIIVISAGLAACTAAEKKELAAEEKKLEASMATSDAMEAKAKSYCNGKGYTLGSKTYMACHEHYLQGLMDAAKKRN